jgi:hypothetical protein
MESCWRSARSINRPERYVFSEGPEQQMSMQAETQMSTNTLA